MTEVEIETKPAPSKFWTDERTEQCRTMWAAGESAGDIAVAIGAPSRNSVLSKIHRCEWEGPNSWGRRPGAAPKKRPTGAKRARPNGFKIPRRRDPGKLPLPPWPLPPASTASTSSFSVDGPKSLQALASSGECHWPVGDPHDPGFGYCAASCRPGYTYCPDHYRIAYVPLSRRSA